MSELREQIAEIVLEVRQYLCNTEFAPEPFTSPVDIDKLKVDFPKKIIALISSSLSIISDEEIMVARVDPSRYLRNEDEFGHPLADVQERAIATAQLAHIQKQLEGK
jgi:hypothetical protein